MVELLTYYVIGGALLVGAPAVFFLIAFMPALQNTRHTNVRSHVFLSTLATALPERLSHILG